MSRCAMPARTPAGAAAAGRWLIDAFLDKIEELVDRSRSGSAPTWCTTSLVAMGFTGAERTTRRAVAAVQKAWRAGHRRVFRPWIPEPGLWLQFDWGDGPRIDGRSTLLFCAWLAWSRFRVVHPDLGPHPADAARLPGRDAAPGRWRADVCVDRQREDRHRRARRPGPGPAPRRGRRRAALRHDGPHLRPGRPAVQGRLGGDGADRQGRPGADRGEPARRVRHLRRARGGLRRVLRPRSTPGRTGRPAVAPVEVLAEERARLHLLPEQPVTVAFGQTRRVCWDCTISVDGVRYSVPHQHVDARVWVRWAGDELFVTVIDPEAVRGRSPGTGAGSADARRSATSTTRPITPAAEPGPATGHPRPPTRPRRRSWPSATAPRRGWSKPPQPGASRVRSKMAEAVTFAKLHGPAVLDQALGTAALAGRFADNDLAAILVHLQVQQRSTATTALSNAFGFIQMR